VCERERERRMDEVKEERKGRREGGRKSLYIYEGENLKRGRRRRRRRKRRRTRTRMRMRTRRTITRMTTLNKD